jgi:hypothetical protein
MRGLNAEARYLLTDIDCGKTKEEAGKALMDQGIQVEMPKPRSAAIFTFREIR